ncbi:cyclic GMP-AMP synthase-like receptor isoform X1 [Danaus plexippus]|uniref:cyclic GMP-AMP synthase-like receptor isoform X1 n=2 Tax=Danaus plexippus TaxID=13037 RepID=UPI002AB2EC59|nr:cyclic GMP-AMP synthase-like receptor isoform X1 [Danaus plexippus]
MNRNPGEREENRGDGWGNWFKYGATALGAGIVAGGIYMAVTSSKKQGDTDTDESSQVKNESNQVKNESSQVKNESTLLPRGLMDIIQGITNMNQNEETVSANSIPRIPCITNLNSLLADIYVRYIAIKREDFDLHFKVFSEVFKILHGNMKAVDKYYERYASNIHFAGSHYDNLRIKKPDEFDMDIVIGLPVNLHVNGVNPEDSDIVIEQRFPAYVQLRAGTQYQNIIIRDGADAVINRAAHSWLDDRKYILRSKFTDWFKSVGNRALNLLPRHDNRPSVVVDGRIYTVRTSTSGPAWTIIMEASGFRLDVDLVPAFKLPEARWPVGKQYRDIPLACRRDYWLVVPKPNKTGDCPNDEHRSWRLALHDQEKQLLHNTYNLRNTIRLIKKFRDEQGMKKIASYYIKTLFFWEILQTDTDFWKKNDVATLFKHMLLKFKMALDNGEIKYFWNGNYNLIGHIHNNILKDYSVKVSNLLGVMKSDYKSVAKYLLSNSEYNEYKHFL